jgi:DnaK suppressor protein
VPQKSSSSLKRYEEQLHQQQRALEKSMQTTVAQGRETAADEIQDAADQAVQSYQKELLFSQGTKGHYQLTLIKQALQRLYDGSFGECVQCETRINERRLEALPWTPYCIDCQKKLERGELEASGRAA